MINSAAGVIYDKDANGKRPRSDKTGYTYSTRSYGVGSSLGLAQSFSKGYRHPLTYHYQEIGYNASVVCSFNASSQWSIATPTDAVQNEWPYPNIYLAKGATPGRCSPPLFLVMLDHLSTFKKWPGVHKPSS